MSQIEQQSLFDLMFLGIIKFSNPSVSGELLVAKLELSNQKLSYPQVTEALLNLGKSFCHWILKFVICLFFGICLLVFTTAFWTLYAFLNTTNQEVVHASRTSVTS